MANYVDASSQTEWAGMMQKNIVRPEALFSPASYPDASTPPDELLPNKDPCVADITIISPAEQRGQPQTPPRSKEPSEEDLPTMSTSPLLARRQNRPNFVPHIDLPSPEMQALRIETLDDEVPVSPPPSGLVLSPVPEANKRFAGHTPLFPRSPSPDMLRKQPPGRHLHPIVPEMLRSLPVHELIVEQDFNEDADTEPQPEEESQSATPQRDSGLTGPLTLAPNPDVGSQNHIMLSVLDEELSKIAQQQARVDGAAEDEHPLSRQGSADSRASEVKPVDGVILKKTVPLNFGAPIGTV